MSFAIETSNLCVSLAGRDVLSDVTLAVPEKQLVVILGPNGGGKTTFLKAICGLLEPSRGTVKLLGGPVKKNAALVGYVPQHLASAREYPVSVQQVVMMGRYRHNGFFRRAGRQDCDAARRALARVGLEGLEERWIDDLSGGERQRVYIARALASEPRILLLDEASSGIDVGMKETLYELLGKLKSEMTIVFVTHDMSVISKQVDMIVCMNKRVVSHGSPEEALSPEALACMYGADMAVFSHCSHGSHIHVPSHDPK